MKRKHIEDALALAAIALFAWVLVFFPGFIQTGELFHYTSILGTAPPQMAYTTKGTP